MQRLLRKWQTARTLMPAPHDDIRDPHSPLGAVFFGSTSHAACEAVDILASQGVAINSLRLLAFPLRQEVIDFINRHDHVFVIEQNRDGQMRMLLINEGQLPPEKLLSVLHFDGLPITAATIVEQITAMLPRLNSPMRQTENIPGDTP
jgi:2-oxoglutarate ferredoxin oxidoreductase subunit alpha